MRSFFVSCVALALLMGACEPKMETTATGARFQFITQSDTGKKATPGDLIEAVVVLRNSKDSIFDGTHLRQQPMKAILSAGPYKDPVEEMLSKMGAGDSVNLFISSDSLLKGAPPGSRPPYVAQGSDVAFGIKVIKITPKAEFEKEQAAKRAQAESDMKAEHERQIGLVKDYATKNKITGTTTESGLVYQITQKGSGESPTMGDTVVVNYKGQTFEGTVFDESAKHGQPFEFVLGLGMVIPGWDEGIAKLNKGAKAVLLIPSDLAYGPQGAGQDIGPNTPLRFDVELVAVKKARR